MMKGAPESIVPLATAIDHEGEVRLFDAAARISSTSLYEQLSADGQRVLAVAYREVDRRDTYTTHEEHNLVRLIRDFMIFVGPVSSIFDFLMFFVLLSVLHPSETPFHTGWFVESLATQTLVLFVIRTMGNSLKSRPSRTLTVTTLAVVAIGVALPA
jgi:magnesium-transporting ATPase (P-type)